MWVGVVVTRTYVQGCGVNMRETRTQDPGHIVVDSWYCTTCVEGAVITLRVY